MADNASPPQNPAQLLAIVNRINLKAFAAKTQQALHFIILNDSAQLVSYDRAILWDISGKAPKILGASGHATISKTSELARHRQLLVQALKDPGKGQVLGPENLFRHHDLWATVSKQQEQTTVFWLPIFVDERPILGLWIERWGNQSWQQQEAELLTFLSQGYGVAAERFQRKHSISSILSGNYRYIAVGILVFSFVVRVPLRVVAPCEVVPNEPILITAPLDGIIAEMPVTPGQRVDSGDVLFEYDKRVPLQELKITQKQVQIIQSELNRTMTQGVSDNESLAEFAVLELKLQKEKLKLKLAEYEASQLTVTAPSDGIVMIDNPDEWRGKPVRVGERVLVVSDPNKTKVKIWVPEDDNVILDREKPVRIFLNINPETSRKARLEYISNYTSISDKQVAGFEAEAHWVYPPKDIKMGLKGSAILYGKNVSLFYYVLRKPWAFLRNLLGL